MLIAASSRAFSVLSLILTTMACVALTTSRLQADEAVVFVTDWKAQAEQGGFYQALAEGLYAAAGLDVTIRPGNAQINVPQLVAAGAADFGLGSNSFIPLNLVAAGAPVRAVMASFQKDPQVLISHPRDDIAKIADMHGKPIMIGDATRSTFWIWLRAKYGFEDSQIRKYTFNLAPFLVDPKAIQQGYLTSEPYLIERETGVPPNVFLLADEGYPGYAAMILVPDRWIETRATMVQAFVDATIVGWRHYLHGNRALGDALILKDNPDMTEDVLAQAVDKMKRFGIVESGDALTGGIGVMTEARWAAFFDLMVAEGIFDETLDFRRAFSLAFVSTEKGDPSGAAATDASARPEPSP